MTPNDPTDRPPPTGRTWVDDLERELTGIVRHSQADPRWDTPGTLAAALNPDTVQTPALDLIDQALLDVVSAPGGRLIVTLPPQEGKSCAAGGPTPGS